MFIVYWVKWLQKSAPPGNTEPWDREFISYFKTLHFQELLSDSLSLCTNIVTIKSVSIKYKNRILQHGMSQIWSDSL